MTTHKFSSAAGYKEAGPMGYKEAVITLKVLLERPTGPLDAQEREALELAVKELINREKTRK